MKVPKKQIRRRQSWTSPPVFMRVAQTMQFAATVLDQEHPGGTPAGSYIQASPLHTGFLFA